MIPHYTGRGGEVQQPQRLCVERLHSRRLIFEMNKCYSTVRSEIILLLSYDGMYTYDIYLIVV